MGNLITGTTVGGCCSKCEMASKGDLWGQWRPITRRDPSVDRSLCSWTSFGGEGPFVFRLIPNFQENPQTSLPRTSTTSMPESALIPAKMSSKAVRILVLGSVNSPWPEINAELWCTRRNSPDKDRNSRHAAPKEILYKTTLNEMGQRDAWVGQQPVTSEKCWVGMQRLHTDCTAAIHTLEFSGQTLYLGCPPKYFS